jgi:hypothetical protein
MDRLCYSIESSGSQGAAISIGDSGPNTRSGGNNLDYKVAILEKGQGNLARTLKTGRDPPVERAPQLFGITVTKGVDSLQLLASEVK